MLLRKLLDPDETARRRRLRAQIVRRNRIHREIAQGLEPKWRRVPRGPERTIHDYGWDPLEHGTAVRADQSRIEHEGNAVAFLVRASTPSEVGRPIPHARARTPVIMEGAQHVQARFAKRMETMHPKTQVAQIPNDGSGDITAQTTGTGHGTPSVSQTVKAKAKQYDAQVRQRWRDVFERLLIQRHQDILRKDANRPWRQERLGLLLFHRHEYKDASEHLIKAITLGVNKGTCWRRLAQCHWHDYTARRDWDALWDAKAAFEQALNHLEMACNPYVLYEYARVLEILGSNESALHAYASLLSTFPRFAQRSTVQLRFVLLQRYRYLTHPMDAKDTARVLVQCTDLTKTLLLDKNVVASEQYPLVLYLHVRLHELLFETTATKDAKTTADVGIDDLYRLAITLGLMTNPSSTKMSWKLWWLQSETFVRWADFFQRQTETIAAADALSRASDLFEIAGNHQTISNETKITLLTAMATNYYDGNQMERAIRAMETLFQLNPYVRDVRDCLASWFPTKWKDRLELEDASQVQIARVLRGLWGRRLAHKRRRSVECELEIAYRAAPFDPHTRRRVVRRLRSKYASLFLAQDLAARRIQHTARKYLAKARVRWAFKAHADTELRGLRSKYNTRKYRYNRHVRFRLAQLVPDEFDMQFRREDHAAALVQRWFRGERVRKTYRATRVEHLRKGEAATCLQRAYRSYRYRSESLAQLHNNNLLFEAQRRLLETRRRLAMNLQRLYRQWKQRLVREELELLARHELIKVQNSSAGRIQRQWRRHVSRKQGDSNANSGASLLLEALRRGHARVLEEDAEATRVQYDGSARTIQAAYRGRRVRQSLVKLTRVVVAPAASEIALAIQDAAMSGRRVAVLEYLASVEQKQILFEVPTIVLRPSGPLRLDHVTVAIEHSRILHTLVLDSGEFQWTRLETLFQSVPRSKTLRVFALGGVYIRRERQSTGPEDVDDEEDNDNYDLENTLNSPMRMLYDTLRTQTFGLEQLLLDGTSLPIQRDTIWLARVVGDYFYGRYGHLRVLAAQRLEISDDIATAFGESLAINTVLQRLNLSGNAIRDAGAEAIASLGVRANSTLVYINLADNAIGSAGARALITSLETTNRTLRTLVLTNNLIMNDAVVPLFRMLQTNAVVNDLDVRGNLIHTDHVAEIESAMRERVAATNEDLRLFLARRRLSQFTQNGGKIQSPLSPVRHIGTKSKRRGAPLSPQKWVQTHTGSTSASLLRPPCVVFNISKRIPIGSTMSLASSKHQKAPRQPTSQTKLPTLVSPHKADRNGF